jgi:ComF family protein
MPALASSLRFLFRSLADFVYPPICYGCDDEVESGLVCEACRLLLYTSELDVCPQCGRPCADAGRGCGHCSEPFALRRVRALGFYAAPFHNLVHALKYDGKTSVAGLLGGALAALAAQDTEYQQPDLVCAVPLHPARLRERGYNQSELLAAVVAEQTGIALGLPLVRHKNTPTQTGRVDAKARRKNLADAFRLRPGEQVSGLKVVLVDDVCTSGATLDAAARPLLAAGASSVLGLVVAAASPAVEKRATSKSRGTRRTAAGKQASPARPAAG